MSNKNDFYCYDGETSGKGEYFLLGTCDDYIFDKKGLSSIECLSFLFKKNCGKKIIFNLHYDIQFWIKDFTDIQILRVMDSDTVIWNGFTLEYYKNKFLKISYKHSTLWIYDIVSFFKKSLLECLKIMKIELTDREKIILDLGKKNRQFNFEAMSKKEIIEYNSTECFVTQRLAKKISDLLENTFFTDLKGEQKNLKVKAFYGASAVSSKIMKAYNIDDLSIKESEMSRQLKNIFEQAYYGGRAECLKIGTFRNVYKYDINSAYPSVMQNLIRISHFTYNKKPNQDRLKDDGIYNISFNFSVPKNFIMPFPLRHKSGMIFFPKRVKGWYFGCEINSFLKNYIFQNEWVDFLLHIKEGFEPVYLQSIQEEISHNENYIFGNCIEELYEQRKVFKQSDDLRAYIIKITLNAMYGKLAQRTGKHQFLNMYYAGYITAKTRSIIYNTSMESYEDIIFFATDCLLSKKKLKNLDVGNELGQWEEKKVNKAVVLMSGIYEIIYSEDSLIYGMRGFRIDNKIFKNILQDIRKKGTTDIILSGFISHKLALTQHKAYGNKRLQFTEIKKNINPFNQIKREFNFKIKNIDNAYNSNYIDMEQTESSLIKNCIYTENLEDRYE